MTTTKTLTTIYGDLGRDITPDDLLRHMGKARYTLKVRKVLNLGDGIVVNVGSKPGRRLLVKQTPWGTFDIEVGQSVDLRYQVTAQERGISIEDLPDALLQLTKGQI